MKKPPSRAGAARADISLTDKRHIAPTRTRQPSIDARAGAFNRRSLAFGPWSPGLNPVERVAQLRCIGGLAAVFLGSDHRLVAVLRRAETDSSALAQALVVVDGLPSLTRRRLLTTFGAVTWPSVRTSRSITFCPDEPTGKFSDLPRGETP